MFSGFFLLVVCAFGFASARGQKDWKFLDGEKKVELCSGGGSYCEWKLKRTENTRWRVNFAAGGINLCPSILNSNHTVFKESFVNELNTGVLPDMSYDRLWKLPKGAFASMASLEPSHGSQPSPLTFPKMLPDTFGKYCKNVNRFRDEFSPGRLCEGEENKHLIIPSPASQMPWCGAWNASAVVGVVDCGVSESFHSHQSTLWSVYSAHGVHSAKDADNHMTPFKFLRSHIRQGWPAEWSMELAVVGYVEGINAPGHFPNEIFPRLLFLDSVLPPDIPMAWPEGEMPREFYEAFSSKGVLSSRNFIFTKPGKPLVQAAKRLFFVTSSTRQGDPLCLWSLHRLVHSAWAKVVPADDPKSGTKTRNVFVLKRPLGRSRALTNHDQLVKKLRASVPASVIVEEIVVNRGDLLSAAKKLRAGKVFIAAHGAGLNNIMMLSNDAAVIEIGYVGGEDFMWPSDYLCLARNLGFTYYASLALSGGQGSDLTANIEEIAAIVKDIVGPKES